MSEAATEWTFLSKPYNMAELERRLREMVLDVIEGPGGLSRSDSFDRSIRTRE